MTPDYVYRHELRCLLCGRDLSKAINTLEERPERIFAPRLRCEVCGGPPTTTGDVIRVRVTPEPRFRPEDLPKRGRRPKNAEQPERFCAWCDLPLAASKWAARLYCSDSCRTAANRAKRAVA